MILMPLVWFALVKLLPGRRSQAFGYCRVVLEHEEEGPPPKRCWLKGSMHVGSGFSLIFLRTDEMLVELVHVKVSAHGHVCDGEHKR